MAGPAWIAAMLVLLAGCQSTVTTSQADSTTIAPSVREAPPRKAGPVGKAAAGPPVITGDAATDPCAMRLHDVSGAILQYFALNHRLPQNLDELRGMADIDVELNFICPVSGKAYVYTPEGIPIPGKDMRAILYDATPAHAGKRWAVVMGDARAGKTATMLVLAVPEQAFPPPSR
jgi:hypothetical protein